MAVQRNVNRAQRVRGRLGRVLRREGVDTNVSEMFYKAVVQVALLFILESWVLSTAMERKLEVTHPVPVKNHREAGEVEVG